MKAQLYRLPFWFLLAGAACAQSIPPNFPSRNMDVYFLFGPTSVKTQTIPGTAVTQSHYAGVSSEVGYGYQLTRSKAGALWLEMNPVVGGTIQPRISALPGTVDISPSYITPGLRFMVPVLPRLSLYAVGGGGVGFFSYPVQAASVSPTTVLVNSTVHGVGDFGGGVDVRLNLRFSIRAEVRDFVSGRELSGIAGRNHIYSSAGVAFHF